MRVTDEMKRRAFDAFCRARKEGIEENYGPVVLAVEAALAPLPEPIPLDMREMVAHARAKAAEAKLAALLQEPGVEHLLGAYIASNGLVQILESKLEKVREALSALEQEAASHPFAKLVGLIADKLKAILDEAP